MLRTARQALTTAVTLGMGMSVAFAAVPAPPVNQTVGFVDTYFNELQEANCRGCHENNWLDATGIPDRHHLLVGTTIPVGACNYSKELDGVTPLACISDAGCQTDPAQLRCKHASSVVCADDAACAAVAYCDHGMCLDGVTACATSADCVGFEGDGGTCVNRDYCKGETEAPNALITDAAYECLDCHSMVFNPITFAYELAQNFRDCRSCHTADMNPLYDEPGHLRGQEANQHHRTEAAKVLGDCAYCHGSIVNDGVKEYIASGLDPAYVPAWLPSYAPSMVTPFPSGKPNGGPNGEGNCNYCHNSGSEAGFEIVDNHDTHHLALSTSGAGGLSCSTCHDATWQGNGRVMTGESIRTCEYCHGIPTLHNIAVDTDGVGFCSDNPATACAVDGDCAGVCVMVDAGNEAAGYSHIGNNADCYGCHGNDGTPLSFTGAPMQSVVTPGFLSIACTGIYEGSAEGACDVVGSAFRDAPAPGFLIQGEIEAMQNGTVLSTTTTVTDDSHISFTINEPIATGKIMIRVVKNNQFNGGARLASSQLHVISVGRIPVVGSASYISRTGVLAFSGTDLGSYTGTPDTMGPSAATNVLCTIKKGHNVSDEYAEIVSWTDTDISATLSDCPQSCIVKTVWGIVETSVTCSRR